MHLITESHLYYFLLQLLILLGLARIFGELFRRWKQPAITAEILVGIVLGPTILGRFCPEIYAYIFPANTVNQSMLETVAWLGILFFLLKTGLEIDFSSAWRQKGDALTISGADIVIPMVIAFVPCLFLPESYIGNAGSKIMFSLFIAAVMTISALPVTARILEDLKLYKTDMGFLIMSALSVNDLIGWIVFTLILSFLTQANPDFMSAMIILFSTLGFVFFFMTYGRKLSDFVVTKFKEKDFPEPGSSLTFICLLGALCGAITVKIGIHALFGFFIAGMVVGEAKNLSSKTKHVISEMIHAFFIPLFFVSVGLTIDFFANFDVFLVVFITVIGIIGRYIGAWVGVSLTKRSKPNRTLIAIAHTPGGEMQIVVGMLALEYGLISQTVFVAIVFGAVFSSIIIGPWMAYALSKRKEIQILDFFKKRSVISNLKADNPKDVISQMCFVLKDNELVEQDNICEQVMEREELRGTALEAGLAVPHARVAGLDEPVIAYAGIQDGVDWDSFDGNPTKNVFMVLSPLEETDDQLQILRAIATVMNVSENRDKLNSVASPEDAWKTICAMFSDKTIKRK